MAIGAPFLGVPKVVRGIISGDRMGLESFLKKHHGIRFARSLGSILGMFPIGPGDAGGAENDITYFDTDGGQSTKYTTVMQKANADNMLKLRLEYYENSPLYCSSALLKAPSVQNFVAIYGIDLPTECKYNYKLGKGKVQLSKSDNLILNGFVTEKGIIYETKQTSTGLPEEIYRDFTKTFWRWNCPIFFFSVVQRMGIRNPWNV